MPAISSFATGDLLPIVDVSEISASDKNKSVTFGELFRNVLGGSASAPSIAFTGDQNTGIYSPGADQVAVATNGTGRLFVDASGNVGVGTSSVNALLEVNNSTAGGEVQRIEGNYSGSGSVILTNWRRAGGSVAAALKYNDDSSPLCMSIGTTTSHEFRIRTVDTDAITIDTSQRVGIGTSSPSAPLHVARSGGGVGLQVQNTSTYSQIEITSGGTDSNAYFTFSPTGTGKGIIQIGGSDKIAIDSSGRVGIGTTTVNATRKVEIVQPSGYNAGLRVLTDGSGAYNQFFSGTSNFRIGSPHNTSALVFDDGASERARIDSSGRLLVGTSSTSAVTRAIFQASSGGSGGGSIYISAGTSNPGVAGGLGQVDFSDSGHVSAGWIACTRDGGTWTSGSSQPTRLVFSTTADGASVPTERDTGLITVNPTTSAFYLALTNNASNSGDRVLLINRQNSDGDLIQFFQADTAEGSISVSGTTVSYNGGHLSRWSQLPNDEDPSPILKGTVMSNLDEMCEWGEEDNEQLNKTKVSDVEGDKDVAGLFVASAPTEDGPLDFYLAMTGDMVIRIAADTTVERGDLLMSAGDGTAKPQDDDIIRSKTIAKVTSTNVSCTYADGSYCVPCVLMAC
jgi:hypothetical protein